MTIELIGFITLLLGFLSFAARPSLLVYVFLCLTLLGSAAAFILDAIGGTNISPSHLLLVFLFIKLTSDSETSQKIREGFAFGRPAFWLLLTVIYAAFSAYFLPRIFAGQIFIYSVRIATKFPLQPDMSNITQTIYLIGDFFCFALMYGYASTKDGIKVLGNAALLCAAMNLVFAALDLLTYFTNTTELLSFVRNSTYALLNDSEVAGFKRIVGSFTEASSFSYATLGYVGFVGTLWLHGIRPRLTAVLTLLSLTALIFSTSTTAYVGLGAFLAFCYLQTLVGMLLRPLTRQMAFFVFAVPIILSAVTVAVALNEAYASYIYGLLDTMVFNKLSTDSGVERSAFNAQALNNFVDTFGFGAGVGSLRASSFPIAVLASLGFIGTLLFGLFFFGVLFGRRRSLDSVGDAYQQAAQSACIAWLIAASISGALVDLGLPFFAFAALACAQPALSSNTRYTRLKDAQLSQFPLSELAGSSSSQQRDRHA